MSMSWQVRALGEAAITFHALRTYEIRSLRAVEDALRRLAWGSRGRLDPAQRTALRDSSCRLIASLPAPAPDMSFRDWIGETRALITTAVAELTDDPVGNVSTTIRARRGDGDRSSREVLPATVAVAVARTVHSAKGETHEAVLLLSAKARGARSNARDWIKGELGEDRDEETRIGYVGLTRARRYCAVALPATTEKEVLDAYRSAGFVFVGEGGS